MPAGATHQNLVSKEQLGRHSVASFGPWRHLGKEFSDGFEALTPFNDIKCILIVDGGEPFVVVNDAAVIQYTADGVDNCFTSVFFSYSYLNGPEKVSGLD